MIVPAPASAGYRCRAARVVQVVLDRLRDWISGWTGATVSGMAASDADNIDPVVLYDMFAEAATRLTGSYFAVIDYAETEAERQQAWTRVRALDELRHGVDPDDRVQQRALIEAWQAERIEVEQQLPEP